MQTPLQITFRGMVPTERVGDHVKKQADKLERFFDRITGCHVTIDTPHRHKKQGQHHRVSIELVVPGKDLVVARSPDDDRDQENLFASIDAAFDDALRLLEDHVRRQRGYVKARATPTRHGRVAKLFANQGYGFIETPEGDEIYFHRHSVLHDGFSHLGVGSRVRFVDEDGDRGPQASTVAIVG
jgi:ribosomal subunit interface protein